MPDGFEPHQELAKIWALQDVIRECRLDTPDNLARLRAIRDDPETPPDTVLRAIDMLWNRAYGKPRQSVVISDVGSGARSKVVILPDNGRSVITEGKVIDADV